MAAGSACAAAASLPRLAEGQIVPGRDLEGRISRIINQYSQQGFHRTGTSVDRASADWLGEKVREAGCTPAREPFSLSRVDLVASALIAGDHRIDGIPLFDGAFTDPSGIRGHLGPSDGEADIDPDEASLRIIEAEDLLADE